MDNKIYILENLIFGESCKTVNGATANATISGSIIPSLTATCYSAQASRIELTNSKPDYSSIQISLIKIYTPSVDITV